MSDWYVPLTLPDELPREVRDAVSQLVTRLAARFSFRGLEDWSVDVTGAKVLGAEREFHDLTRTHAVDSRMRVYFARRPDAVTFAAILRRSFDDLQVGAPRALANRDWMKAWRKHYKTQLLREGKHRLAVVPAWKKAPKGTLSVRITPGQAFGTGTHPTTQLCLRLLLRHGLAARRVLDFGAGTGVLLLAAARVAGAKGVAVESDPVALAQARKNARLNRIDGVRFSGRLPKGEFDLVFANVLAPVLLAHRKALHAATKPGGLIFLSGILRTEAAAFLREFRARHHVVVERLDQGDWSAIALLDARKNKTPARD